MNHVHFESVSNKPCSSLQAVDALRSASRDTGEHGLYAHDSCSWLAGLYKRPSSRADFWSNHVSFLNLLADTASLRIAPFYIDIDLSKYTMGSYTDPSVRIASASGSVTDRRHGFAELARDEDVHFIVGDWMSEYNMTQRGSSKVQTPLDCAYEPTFIESITPALDSLSRNHIKVAVNAGASDTRRLCQDLLAIIDSKGLDLNVAYVEGDEVLDVVQTAQQSGQIMRNLTTGTDSYYQ